MVSSHAIAHDEESTPFSDNSASNAGLLALIDELTPAFARRYDHRKKGAAMRIDRREFSKLVLAAATGVLTAAAAACGKEDAPAKPPPPKKPDKVDGDGGVKKKKPKKTRGG